MEKRLLFLLCVGLVAVKCSKTEGHECEIKTEFGNLYVDEIYDNVTGVIQKFDTLQVKSASIEGTKYLTAAVEDNKIIVSVTKAFASYEENETDRSIKATLKYMCDSGKEYTKEFVQDIAFINNHVPTFDKPQYNFIHYGDLPEGFELTNLIQIGVRDVDIEESLRLNIKDNNNFHSNIVQTTDPKTFEIKLYNRERIPASAEKILTLIVKDGSSYNPPNNEITATLTIKLISLTEEEPFKFTKSPYHFTLKDGAQLISDEEITIVNGFDSKLEVSIEESEYSEYFSVEANAATGSIKLIVDQELPNIGKRTMKSHDADEIKLKIIARANNKVAETEVVISANDVAKICYVPGVDFDYKYIRNGYINDAFVGVIYNISNIKNVKGITCTEKKYLDCVFDIDSGEFTISTTDNFNNYEETISKNSLVTNVTFECPYEDITMNFIQSIEDVNNHSPLFNEEEYNFVFYESLPKDFEITSLKDVMVTDKDLSHNRYYFHLPEEAMRWFSIDHCYYIQDRTCRPHLYTSDSIPVPFNLNFELKVEDDLTPKKSTMAKFNIKILEDEQVQQGFSKAEYLLYRDRTTTARRWN